jgi:ribosomal protein L11 methyltransferase
VPYRVDLPAPADDAFDRLIELGALDIEPSPDGGLAALMPDSITPDDVASALGLGGVRASPAVGRDDDSIWVLAQRPTRVGRFTIVPEGVEAGPDTLRLIDAPAFGTGLHPTTALCLETLEEEVAMLRPDEMLDVGTGSGILAIAALMLGVPRATAIDIDEAALEAAAENARVNAVGQRLRLTRGGPDAITGTWPLVLANVLAAPLIEMAPVLVRRIGHHGRVVLSGIPASVEQDVEYAYRHLGMRRVGASSRGGWVALVMDAPW